MSVIEECAKAILDETQYHVDERCRYDDMDEEIRCVKAVLTTLAGKLDEDGLEAAYDQCAAYDAASQCYLRDAIRSYLNQLINEEKE